MKNSKLILGTLAALIFVSCNNQSTTNQNTNSKDSTAQVNQAEKQTFNFDTNTLASGAVFYQCSMHPEVISDKPGNCPKCEMNLSEMKKH